jgi:hypothetical protein
MDAILHGGMGLSVSYRRLWMHERKPRDLRFRYARAWSLDSGLRAMFSQNSVMYLLAAYGSAEQKTDGFPWLPEGDGCFASNRVSAPTLPA